VIAHASRGKAGERSGAHDSEPESDSGFDSEVEREKEASQM